MSRQDFLKNAKKDKKDEFYTRYEDIEYTVQKIVDDKNDIFKGKTILCPCDDPDKSNFVKYFKNNFNKFGIKKLICTCYAQSVENFPLFGGSMCGKAIEITEAGERKFDLNSDGDFRGREVSDIRDSVDFIITNPPFSLFRDFFKWCLQAKTAMFLTVGHLNAVGHIDVFPHIQSGRVKIADGYANEIGYFLSPYDSFLEKDDEIIRVNGIVWYTDIDIDVRKKPQLIHNSIHDREYDKYDFYDALYIESVKQIPFDYDGVMGVPATILKYNYFDDFEIVGAFNHGSDGWWDLAKPIVKGKERFKRIAIKRKTAV